MVLALLRVPGSRAQPRGDLLARTQYLAQQVRGLSVVAALRLEPPCLDRDRVVVSDGRMDRDHGHGVPVRFPLQVQKRTSCTQQARTDAAVLARLHWIHLHPTR